MADIVYNRCRYNNGKKLQDLSADDLKVALVGSGYTPNVDHNAWADVSANEVTGTNYTAGGQSLANKTFAQDNTSDNAKLDADDTTWPNLTVAGARWAVIYNNTLAGKDLVVCLDLGSSQSVTATDFRLQYNALGITTF